MTITIIIGKIQRGYGTIFHENVFKYILMSNVYIYELNLLFVRNNIHNKADFNYFLRILLSGVHNTAIVLYQKIIF